MVNVIAGVGLFALLYLLIGAIVAIHDAVKANKRRSEMVIKTVTTADIGNPALSQAGAKLQPQDMASAWAYMNGSYVYPITLGKMPTDVPTAVPTIDQPRKKLLDSITPVDEVVQGYRGYTLVWGKGGLCLRGTRVEWPTATYVATCGSGDTELAAYHLGGKECQCGLYVFSNQPEVPEEFPIWAHCVAYGWVVPYERGWRAEKVRIDSLYYTPPANQIGVRQIAELLELRYEVPVRVWSTEDMTWRTLATR